MCTCMRAAMHTYVLKHSQAFTRQHRLPKQCAHCPQAMDTCHFCVTTCPLCGILFTDFQSVLTHHCATELVPPFCPTLRWTLKCSVAMEQLPVIVRDGYGSNSDGSTSDGSTSAMRHISSHQPRHHMLPSSFLDCLDDGDGNDGDGELHIFSMQSSQASDANHVLLARGLQM